MAHRTNKLGLVETTELLQRMALSLNQPVLWIWVAAKLPEVKGWSYLEEISVVNFHQFTGSRLTSREVTQEAPPEVNAAGEREVEQIADCHLSHSEWR